MSIPASMLVATFFMFRNGASATTPSAAQPAAPGDMPLTHSIVKGVVVGIGDEFMLVLTLVLLDTLPMQQAVSTALVRFIPQASLRSAFAVMLVEMGVFIMYPEQRRTALPAARCARHVTSPIPCASNAYVWEEVSARGRHQ